MTATLERPKVAAPPRRAEPRPVPRPAGRAAAPVGPAMRTVLDVAARFGDIPLHRIVLDPAPGTATADDIDRVLRETGRACELIDGTLIEKAVSTEADLMGLKLAALFLAHVEDRGIGWALGGQAFLRLSGRRLRAADAAVVLYGQVDGDRFPGPSDGGPAYPDLYPDLAVEILSPSNTAEEMREKRADCFGAGTRLVWEIDPATETAAVYTSVDEPDEELGRDGVLDGRDVLPGFSVTVGAVLDAVRKRPAA